MAQDDELAGLDLSFVRVTKPEAKPTPTRTVNGLDASFLDPEPQSPAETAEQIIRQRDEGGFPQGSRKDRGFFESLPDMFTGADRETAATRELPELLSDAGLKYMLGDKADVGLAAGTLTAFDPVEVVQMLSEHAEEDLSVRPDEAGNIIVSVDGREAMLNKPGLSSADLMKLGTITAGFTPVGRLARGAGIIRAASQVGAGSAGVQAGIESLHEAQGGEFDGTDVAIAGGAGAGFQALFQSVAKSVPMLQERIARSGITDEVRNKVRQAAAKAGLKPSDVTDDVIQQMARQSDEAVKPEQALAIHGEKEFGIPLTSGQRSLDDAALSFEDRARAGIQGEPAQRVMRGFEQQTQLPAIGRARQNIEGGLGGAPMSRQQTGSAVREGIQGAERSAAQAVDSAYDQVGDAALKPDAINKLYNATRKAVIGIDKDRNLRSTRGLLDQLKRSQKVFTDLQKAGAKVKPKHINEIELLRRRVNTAAGAAENATDRAQVLQMKRGLDDFMDRAVRNALFEGDAQALSALKNARGTFREYAKKFRSSPTKTRSGRTISDPEGAFIEKIVEANPTDEQIVNAVFGANNFSSQSGARMAGRFKDILGPESEGWQAIRQEAFRRLIKTNRVNNQEVISGAKTLSAIEDAMDKNASLVREIFSPEEIGTFRRFAAQVKRTQPDLVRSRENPSGTAQVAAKTVGDYVSGIAGILGEPTLFVGARGVQVAKGASSSAKAKRSVRPFEEIIRTKPSLPGLATAGTMAVVEN